MCCASFRDREYQVDNSFFFTLIKSTSNQRMGFHEKYMIKVYQVIVESANLLQLIICRVFYCRLYGYVPFISLITLTLFVYQNSHCIPRQIFINLIVTILGTLYGGSLRIQTHPRLQGYIIYLPNIAP